MKISINANRCEPSPMRKFHPLAVKAVQEGKKIYHLNIGQPDLPTPEAFYEAIRAFNHSTLAYDVSPGNPVMIEAIRNYYARLGVTLEPDDIFITTGGSEALLFTCLSILDPYDDADKFQQWLLTEFSDNGETVMFAPGAPFYETPGSGVNEVRIAYVLEQKELQRAMVLLGEGISRYRAEKMGIQ